MFIQKEVGDRIVAKPRSSAYGALGVWMQAIGNPRIVRVMPPSVFWPRPKVDSAIIQIVDSPQKRSLIPDLKFFNQFVRALFFHRRKFLRSVLSSAVKGRLSKEQVDEMMASLSLGDTARADALPVRKIVDLAEQVRRRLPDGALYLLEADKSEKKNRRGADRQEE